MRTTWKIIRVFVFVWVGLAIPTAIAVGLVKLALDHGPAAGIATLITITAALLALLIVTHEQRP